MAVDDSTLLMKHHYHQRRGEVITTGTRSSPTMDLHKEQRFPGTEMCSAAIKTDDKLGVSRINNTTYRMCDMLVQEK